MAACVAFGFSVLARVSGTKVSVDEGYCLGDLIRTTSVAICGDSASDPPFWTMLAITTQNMQR